MKKKTAKIQRKNTFVIHREKGERWIFTHIRPQATGEEENSSEIF